MAVALKIIDGITVLIANLLTGACTLLGVYAASEIIFGMDIPLLYSFFVVVLVFLFAYFISQESEKERAIPITIIPDAIADRSIRVAGDK